MNAMTPEQIATATLGNWVKDVTDERTVTQIIAQAIELDRATTRSLAAYQQISDVEERLSSSLTTEEKARSLIIEARTSLYWRGSLVQRLADVLEEQCRILPLPHKVQHSSRHDSGPQAEPSNAEVEVAAKTLANRMGDGPWEDLLDTFQEDYRQDARAALRAAAEVDRSLTAFQQISDAQVGWVGGA